MRLITAALLTSAALATTPAYAATVGEATLDYSFTMPSMAGVSLNMLTGDKSNTHDATGSGAATSSATVGGLTGALAARSEANGLGGATAAAESTWWGFDLENDGDTPLTYVFDVTYTLSASAFRLHDGDAVSATAHLVFSNADETLLEKELSFDVANLGSDTLTGTQTLSIVLGAYDFGTVDVAASVSTQASSTVVPAPVPLPAAGWMLLAGLGTIAALRKRS